VGGIGTAISRRLCRDGFRVVAGCGPGSARKDRWVEEMRAEGLTVFASVGDVSDWDSTKAAFDRVKAEHGPIDVLVNNAGLALGLEPAQRASLDEWDTMIATNCRGLVTMTRAVLPGMVERNRGHVVNIGSVAAGYPYPGGNVYGATKAFVHQFTLNLRSDLLGTAVRATVIEPGMAETEFSLVRFSGDAAKAKKVYEGVTPLAAADVAEAVLWTVSLPAHVNVNVMELMAVQQAFAPFAIHRK
jgi:NADP-dependent 3-hydroxy acid dehydrogenase YdfG